MSNRGQALARSTRGQACARCKRGQATVEMLPSIIIFLIVISASLSYFRAMRTASIRQEAARNLIMAKIGNSGTLTTPPDQMDGGQSDGVRLLTVSGHGDIAGPAPASYTPIKASDNAFISSTTGCFSVFGGPEGVGVREMRIGAYFIGFLTPIKMVNYAVIYREATSSTCP